VRAGFDVELVTTPEVATQLTFPDSKPGFTRSWAPALHVAVKFLPVAFGPTVTDWDVGENVQPAFDGVTV